MYRGHLTRILLSKGETDFHDAAANCRGGAIFIIKWGEARRTHVFAYITVIYRLQD